jgi:hypothetical protein
MSIVMRDTKVIEGHGPILLQFFEKHKLVTFEDLGRA